MQLFHVIAFADQTKIQAAVFQTLMDISDVFVCTAKYKRQLLERLHLSEQDWEEADKEEDLSGRNSEKGNGRKVQKESEVLDNLEHQLLARQRFCF